MSLNKEKPKEITVKVRARSNVKGTAGSLVKHFEESVKGVDNPPSIIVSTVGAGALNQATKAIATARGMLISKGFTIYTAQYFGKVTIEGKERTSILQRLIFQEV